MTRADQEGTLTEVHKLWTPLINCYFRLAATFTKGVISLTRGRCARPAWKSTLAWTWPTHGTGLFHFPSVPFSSPVQRPQPPRLLGHVAPHSGGRSVICDRKHLQLPAPHLPVHCELSPGAPADLAGEDAPGHSKVPVHILPRAAGLCERPESAVLLLRRNERVELQRHTVWKAE